MRKTSKTESVSSCRGCSSCILVFLLTCDQANPRAASLHPAIRIANLAPFNVLSRRDLPAVASQCPLPRVALAAARGMAKQLHHHHQWRWLWCRRCQHSCRLLTACVALQTCQRHLPSCQRHRPFFPRLRPSSLLQAPLKSPGIITLCCGSAGRSGKTLTAQDAAVLRHCVGLQE